MIIFKFLVLILLIFLKFVKEGNLLIYRLKVIELKYLRNLIVKIRKFEFGKIFFVLCIKNSFISLKMGKMIN